MESIIPGITNDCIYLQGMFIERGINLTWFDYIGYPEYLQLWGEFIPGVTILDLLFNCGKDAHRYMRYVRS